MSGARKRDDAPYRAKIEPTFGVQARVRVWHNRTGDVVCDVTLWGLGVKARAESLARAAASADRARRFARAREASGRPPPSKINRESEGS